MPKFMDKEQVVGAATRKRREDNYQAKKRNKTLGTDFTGEARGTGSFSSNRAPTAPQILAFRNETSSSGEQNLVEYVKDPQTISEYIVHMGIEAEIPFRTQLRILVSVQRWVEEAMFDFFRRWLPAALALENADMAEKIELSHWIPIMLQNVKVFPKHAIGHISGSSLTQELKASHQLRDVALNREHVSTVRLLELIGPALNLVIIMKDEKKTALLESLTEHVTKNMHSMRSRQEEIKHALSHDLSTISRVVEYLSKKGRPAEQPAAKDEKDCVCAAKFLYEQRLNELCTMLNQFLDIHETKTTDQGSHEFSKSIPRPKTSIYRILRLLGGDTEAQSSKSSTTNDTPNDSSLPQIKVSNPPEEDVLDPTKPQIALAPASTAPISDVWERAKDIHFSGHAAYSVTGSGPASDASAGAVGLDKMPSRQETYIQGQSSSDIPAFKFCTTPAPPPLIDSYVHSSSPSFNGSSKTYNIPFKFKGQVKSDSFGIPPFNFNAPMKLSPMKGHSDYCDPTLFSGGSTTVNPVWETTLRLVHPSLRPIQTSASAASNQPLDFDFAKMSLSDFGKDSILAHNEQKSSIGAGRKEQEGTKQQAGSQNKDKEGDLEKDAQPNEDEDEDEGEDKNENLGEDEGENDKEDEQWEDALEDHQDQ